MKVQDLINWTRAMVLRNLPKIAGIARRDPELFANLRGYWHLMGDVDAAELDSLLAASRAETADRFLSLDDLRELTGYKSVACQVKWLKRQGVRHHVTAHGRPVAMWASLEGRKHQDALCPRRLTGRPCADGTRSLQVQGSPPRMKRRQLVNCAASTTPTQTASAPPLMATTLTHWRRTR